MSFLVMQTVIAKICVDHHFRRSFLRNPDESLELFELTADECEAVKALDWHAVELYADSLLKKKMGTIAKWFPLCMAALRRGLPPERLQRILYNYGAEHIRDSGEVGGGWVRLEFLQFRDYLRGLIASGEIDLPHFADVLEFEATRAQMSQNPAMSRGLLDEDGLKGEALRVFADGSQHLVRPLLGSHASIRKFNCNIVALMAHVENEPSPPPVGAEPTWVLFVKKRRTAKVIVQTLNPALKDVLELCDGTRTTSEVLAAIVARHALPAGMPEEDVRADCLAVLQQLYTSGTLTVAELATVSAPV